MVGRHRSVAIVANMLDLAQAFRVMCGRLREGDYQAMNQLAAQPFFDIYTSLPTDAQARLRNEAAQVQAALDRAIHMILQPTVARSGDEFLTCDEVIPLYGMGKTPQAAMDDYRSVLVEYYESLEADADHLGEVLQAQLAILRKVFALLEPLH